MSLLKRFGWGSSGDVEPPQEFQDSVAGEVALCVIDEEEEVDYEPYIAAADVVGLARALYPALISSDDLDQDDDDHTCLPCVGGAILLTYSRFWQQMGLPPLPEKVQPGPMPSNELLEMFFSWLLRLSKRIDGHATSQKRARQRARDLSEQVIARNDIRQFDFSWQLAQAAMPASLFAAIRDNYV